MFTVYKFIIQIRNLKGSFVQGTGSWINGEKCQYEMTNNSIHLSGFIVSQNASNTIVLSGLPDLSKYNFHEHLCILYKIASKKGTQYYIGVVRKNNNSSVLITLNENLEESTGLFFDIELKLYPID